MYAFTHFPLDDFPHKGLVQKLGKFETTFISEIDFHSVAKKKTVESVEPIKIICLGFRWGGIENVSKKLIVFAFYQLKR